MTWRRARRIAGLILMAGSVAYVIWRIVSDDEARAALGSVGVLSLAGLVALQAIYLLPQAYRYLLALRLAASQPIPALAWFRLFVLGRFLNSLIPQAGTFYRGLRLKEDYQVPVARYLGGFVAFTWLSTILNLAVASIVIALVEPDLEITGVSALTVTVGLLAAAAAGPPLLLWVVRRLRLHDGVWGWARRRLEELLTSALALVRDPEALGKFTVVGMVGLGIALLIFWGTFASLDLDVSISAILLFFVLLQLSTYVNITPGNLGLLELGFGALGSQLGIGLVGGLLVAAVVRISGYIALMAAGLMLGGIAALRLTRTFRPHQTGR
jgi:uncharacterized membrane protein YbhN (UPF0104 family)